LALCEGSENPVPQALEHVLPIQTLKVLFAGKFRQQHSAHPDLHRQLAVRLTDHLDLVGG
jgi:hypothetical protein